MVRARLPELRMIVVAGPRIDPLSLEAPTGVEVCTFVPELDRRLAACRLIRCEPTPEPPTVTIP
jgi:hypothetical protein